MPRNRVCCTESCPSYRQHIFDEDSYCAKLIEAPLKVRFKMSDEQDYVTQEISIQNITDSHVAFTVGTSNPDVIRVHPETGFLEPYGEEIIKVTLATENCQSALEQITFLGRTVNASETHSQDLWNVSTDHSPVEKVHCRVEECPKPEVSSCPNPTPRSKQRFDGTSFRTTDSETVSRTELVELQAKVSELEEKTTALGRMQLTLTVLLMISMSLVLLLSYNSRYVMCSAESAYKKSLSQSKWIFC